MSIVQAIILGIVEGITEFLPISSTGHLILVTNLLQISQSEFLKSFEIFIQLGAVLAVVVVYRRSLTFDSILLKKIAVAFLPTAIIGFLFYSLVKKYLLGNTTVVLISLLVGGIALIIFEKYYQSRQGEATSQGISWRHAWIIGFFQSLALIPGVSRAAATIVGGLLLGYNRKTIVEFSFLLAIPTMLAATGWDLYKSANMFSVGQIPYLAIGFIVSFITALLAIKWLLRFIQNHNFMWFGVYRIIVAVAFFLLI